MKYSLDTNTCIAYLNDATSLVAQRMAAQSPSDITVCSVVRAELWYGALRSRNPAQAMSILGSFLIPFQSAPFDDAAAKTYGELRQQLAGKGTPIGPNDLLIAAIAKTKGLKLVTHNIREFTRVSGLMLEDWEVA